MSITIAAGPCTLQSEILQAARQVVESGQFTVYLEDEPWAGAGIKNPPLLTLLDCLIDAAGSLAAAIADNATDDSLPVPLNGAKQLAENLHRIADLVTAAAAAPDPNVASVRMPAG
ncbi:MAG: hypothetical protein RL014_2093 [Pseudomonadota bacterium]|jgi:hypothetical protein